MTKVSTRNKDIPFTRDSLVDWLAEAHHAGTEFDHISLDHDDSMNVIMLARATVPCSAPPSLLGYSCEYDAPESALWKR